MGPQNSLISLFTNLLPTLQTGDATFICARPIHNLFWLSEYINPVALDTNYAGVSNSAISKNYGFSKFNINDTVNNKSSLYFSA